MILSKLAMRNAKRSIKDYIVYLITVTLAFSLIFAFQLVGISNEVINLSDIMQNFKIVMIVVNIFIVAVISYLINYTIKFMFCKRSKEFATYLILGINKKQISKLFILENIILGFFSFFASIPIGYVFSLIMSYVINNIFDVSNQVTITFHIKSIIFLMVYFLLIYLVVFFFARRRIKKMKIYDLLYFDKQNEQLKQNNKKIRNIIFIVTVLLGGIAFLLFHYEFSQVGKEPSLKIILLCLIFIIISIYGVTITLSDFILTMILNNKKLKYRKDYLFIVRTFSSKVRMMCFTMGTVTLLITFTLIALNLSSLFKGIFDYQLELNAPYDISIKTTRDDMDKYLDFIDEKYTIQESFIYDSYQDFNHNISKLLGNPSSWYNVDHVVRISDYNQLLEMKGDKKVSLKEDEYLLHVTKEYHDKLRNKPELKEITLSNGVVLRQKDFVSTGYTYAWGSSPGFIIVVPDQVVDKLKREDSHLIVNTKEDTTEKFAKEMVNLSNPELCKENDLGYMVCYSLSNIIVRGQEEANNNGLVTMISFVCFYIAFVFIAVVGTILAIQSLSDSTKYKYRYQVLYQLGVNSGTINKIILKQLIIFFFVPMIYPIIISLWTIFSMNQVFQMLLTTNTIYLNYYFLNLLLFLLTYIIYFVTTYFYFKKI